MQGNSFYAALSDILIENEIEIHFQLDVKPLEQFLLQMRCNQQQQLVCGWREILNYYSGSRRRQHGDAGSVCRRDVSDDQIFLPALMESALFVQVAIRILTSQ